MQCTRYYLQEILLGTVGKKNCITRFPRVSFNRQKVNTVTHISFFFITFIRLEKTEMSTSSSRWKDLRNKQLFHSHLFDIR